MIALDTKGTNVDANEKEAVKALLELKNNLIVWKSNGRKVPRIAHGYIKLLGKVWPSREVIAVLMEDMVDRRTSASFNMARSLPDMEISRKDAKALGLKIYQRVDRASRATLDGVLFLPALAFLAVAY